MSSTTPPPTRLLLIRHGESEVTVRRVIGGPRTCSGLSDLGRRQAEALRDRLLAHPIEADVLISSHYPRAIETAEIIAPALGVVDTDFERDPGWGEHDPGPDVDGMSFSAYVDRFGTPDWDGDPDADIFPGGETTRVFHERVRRAIDRARSERSGRTVVVACHGGVVDVAFRHLLDGPMTGSFELHTLNTSLTEFVELPSGRWRLARYNDAAHLAGLPEATRRVDPDES